MKKILPFLLILLIALSTDGWGQIISQYIETNSGSTPKGVEIWNNTALTLDFSVNNLVIKKGSNGGAPSPDFTLSNSTLAAGEVIVIGTSDMEAITVSNGSVFHLKPFTFNGDDALEVWYGTTKTDVFGEPGVDPGSAWSGNGVSTKNQNIQLKTGITTGDTDGWSNPSIRFETVNTDPSGTNGDEGFGIAPTSPSGVDNPTSFTATTNSTDQIDLAWVQNTNTDDVMVAWTTDGTFGSPVDGTYYAATDVITGGGTVLFNGSGTSYNHTNLTSNTQYYYKAWSVDGTTIYSSGVTDDATTYKDEPTNHVASFATGAATASTIPLSWLDNDGTVIADGYLIKASTSSTFIDPVDGTQYADDTDMSDGSGLINVVHGVETYTFAGLNPSTTYYFKIWPYTNSLTAIVYKTDGTVPTANETTTAPTTTILPYSQPFDTDLGDCYTYSVSGDTKGWEWYSSGYAQMNGHNGSNPEEDWLILPGIDFSLYSNVIMNFETQWKYGGDDANNYLKLYYSTDYSGSGDPTGSTWTELSFTTSTTAEEWISSGDIDLSSISAPSVHLGFKYYSTDDPRRWDIDNINIQESSTNPEPSNYPTSFTATTNSAYAITTNWVDAIGTQLPVGYVILANLTGTFTAPIDGTPVNDDTDLSDGEGAMNIAYGTETYQWTGLTDNTQYFFTIFPYTNSAGTIDYKTDGIAPTDDATTDQSAPEPVLGDLVINEVNSTATANATYVEIYNKTASELSLEKVNLSHYNNGSATASVTLNLTGTINANSYIVISRTKADFYNVYSFYSDFELSGMYLNGGTDGVLLSHDDNGVLDQFNDVPSASVSWSDNHLFYRFDYSSNGSSLENDWDDSGSTKNGTPKAKNEITWLTTGTDDWGTENNWSNGDEPSRGVDVIIPSGGTQPVCDGTEANPEQCYYLTINTGAILTIKVGGFLTINRTVTNSTGASGLVVESDNTGNGSLISEDGVTATVKRYFNQYTSSVDGWHYIGSPVDDMTIAGSDFDPTGTANDLYAWDEVSYLWRSFQNGTFSNLVNGIGYMVAYVAEVTNSFTGTLNSTDVSFSNLTKTTGKGEGWHLLGNPYASALKWNDGNWTLTNIGGVAKVYDESEGNYVDVNENDIIPSTNGFFVQVSSATNSITIPAAARTHDDANNYKNSRAEMDETLQLLVNNDANNFSDKTNIGFRDDAEMSFDWDFDSHKMFGQSTAPQLWTLVDGENYSTNNLPPVFENMELPLNFKAGVTSTYHILAEGLESFYVNSEIYLEDKQLDVTINLREEPMYTFNGQPSDDNARFVLHFFGVTNVNDIYDSEKVIIYGSENTIFIKTEEVNKQYSIEVYDIMGRKLLSDTFSSIGLNTFKLSANAGVYIVKLQSAYGTHIEKINLR